MAKRVQVDITARDKGSGVVKKFAKNTKVSFTEINQAIELAKKGFQAFEKVFEISKIGAKLLQQEAAFKRLAKTSGTTSRQLLADLKAASNGMVSTAVIIEKAGTAMLTGVRADKLADLMKIAAASAKITGQEVSTAFSDIALAVARGSKMILDNLGIIVSLEEANKNYAKQLGKTAKELTDVERKQAFLNETIKKGNELANRVGTDVNSTIKSVYSASTELKELWDFMTKKIAEELAPAWEKVASIIHAINESLNAPSIKIKIDIKNNKEFLKLKKEYEELLIKQEIASKYGGADALAFFDEEDEKRLNALQKILFNAENLKRNYNIQNEQLKEYFKEAKILYKEYWDFVKKGADINALQTLQELEDLSEKYEKLGIKIRQVQAAMKTSGAGKTKWQPFEGPSIPSPTTMDSVFGLEGMFKVWDEGINDKLEKSKTASEEAAKADMEARNIRIGLIQDEFDRERAELEIWYAEKKQMFHDSEEIMARVVETYNLQIMDIRRREHEEELQLAIKAAEKIKNTEIEKLEGIKEANKRAYAILKDMEKKRQEKIKEGAAFLRTSFEGAFGSIVDGTKSVGDAFKDMLLNMVSDISKALMSAGFKKLFEMLAKSASGSGTGGGIFGALGALLTSSANGNVLKGGFTPFATGGVVNKPTFGLVGEGKMNEAVVPLPDGRRIPVDMKGNNGMTIVNNITVDSSGGNTETDRKQAGEIARALTEKIKMVLRDEKRHGGLLAGGAY